MTTHPDEILHAITDDGDLRVLVATMTHACRDACQVHDAGPVATIALGHALMSAALLRATWKATEQVHLQFDGKGPLGVVIARALPGGEVYGTVGNPQAENERDADGSLRVGAAIGTQGTLMVSRQQPGAAPYTGMVPLSTGRVADEIMHYLSTSEQIRSAVGLGMQLDPTERVVSAGGFLIQILGGVPDERLQRVDARIASIAELGSYLSEGASAEELLHRLLGSESWRLLARAPVRHRAPHDRNYYLLRLASLGSRDLAEIFGRDAEIEIVCEFTRERHRFSRAEIERCARSLSTLE